MEINTKLIEDYMKKHKLSKTKFCKLCKITLLTFNKIMAGIYANVNIKVLFRIGKQMNIPVCEMFAK